MAKTERIAIDYTAGPATPEAIADILRLAEQLGWPVGVECNVEDPAIVSGGEQWWRAWTDGPDGLRAYADGDFIASGLLCTLEWAAEIAGEGDDPGPTSTWEMQATDAIMSTVFRRPYRN